MMKHHCRSTIGKSRNPQINSQSLSGPLLNRVNHIPTLAKDVPYAFLLKHLCLI